LTWRYLADTVRALALASPSIVTLSPMTRSGCQRTAKVTSAPPTGPRRRAAIITTLATELAAAAPSRPFG
jgi:hypothetical protein